MSDRLTVTYTETCNLIRHYDTLKYTCWTVYTALVGGMYFAKSEKEINEASFVFGIVLASTYFCFLLTRIQKNYKIYCSVAEDLESIFRNEILQDNSTLFSEKFRVGPFDLANTVLPGNFRTTSFLEKAFGSVPYFTLHIVFFVGVSLLAILVLVSKMI